jgi:hypothetical protein
MIRMADNLGQLIAKADAGQKAVLLEQLERLRITGVAAIINEPDRGDFEQRIEAAKSCEW